MASGAPFVLTLLRLVAHPPFSLQPGGYLVSLGPLLYHWADAHTYLAGEELSVELSLEEVKAAAEQVGWGWVGGRAGPSLGVGYTWLWDAGW